MDEVLILQCPSCKQEPIEVPVDQFINEVFDSGLPICPECGEDLERIEGDQHETPRT